MTIAVTDFVARRLNYKLDIVPAKRDLSREVALVDRLCAQSKGTFTRADIAAAVYMRVHETEYFHV